MKTRRLIGALFVAVGFAGCVTPPPPPPEAAHIKLATGNSEKVIIERAWIARDHDQLFLSGDVYKKYWSTDTTKAHLDVTLFDAAGRILRETVVRLEPAQIPNGHRMHGHSHFRVALEPLALDVMRIQVRAHEGEHPPAS